MDMHPAAAGEDATVLSLPCPYKFAASIMKELKGTVKISFSQLPDVLAKAFPMIPLSTCQLVLLSLCPA